MVRPRIGCMRGNGTASGETGMAALSTLAATGLGGSSEREVLLARRNAARFSALVSGSKARSSVWPTTSTGLGVGFGVTLGVTFGAVVLGLRLISRLPWAEAWPP